MKKMTKLSLVAAMMVAGSTFANADDHAAVKVSGEVKYQYFGESNVGKEDSTIHTVGGRFGIETKEVNGLSAKATFQTSKVLDKDDASGVTNGTENVDGSVLSEAYVQYNNGATSVKMGRQFVNTPLVKGSGSRQIKDSFAGVVAANKSLPNTVIAAGYVNRYHAMTDGNGGVPAWEDISTDGAYTVLFQNTSINNLKVTGQYATVKDDAADTDIMYVQGDMKVGAAKVSAQYMTSEVGTADSGDLMGVKVSTKLGAVKVAAAYTTTGDVSVVHGLGKGAYAGFAKVGLANLKSKAYSADTDSMMLKASTDVNGVKLTAGVATYDVDGNDYQENHIGAGYKISKSTKLTASYNTYTGDADTMENETRVQLAYKF